MFELAKLNTGTSYASTFDQKFKDIMAKTHKNPKLSDMYAAINEHGSKPSMKRLKWTFDRLYDQIQDIADRIIDDKTQWSVIGKSLFKAARERQSRWIIFTFSLEFDPEEDMNLALVSCILNEIYAFADYARHNNLPISLGVLMDELHTYVKNKDASTKKAIHNLLMAWGRSSKVLRAFITQHDDQLPKEFKDDIGKNLQTNGKYDVIIKCSRLPESGTLEYLNGATPNPKDIDQPIWYPQLKSCPPLCEVEADEVDNDKWKKKMLDWHFRQKELYKS